MREPVVRSNVRRSERGFTLIELGIVVAILGILGAIVIPNWAQSARNRKYDPEISAMFTEISTREEQYKSEIGNGAYLDEAECPGSPTPNGSDFNATCVTTGSTWATLRVVPTDSAIRCTYQVSTGLPSIVPAPPAPCVLPVNTVAGSWYYTIATCDMDGDGAPYSTFCMASWNTTVQKSSNYGQ